MNMAASMNKIKNWKKKEKMIKRKREGESDWSYCISRVQIQANEYEENTYLDISLVNLHVCVCELPNAEEREKHCMIILM